MPPMPSLRAMIALVVIMDKESRKNLLNMNVKELAARARVATDTIVRLENGRDMKPRTVDAIRMALEAAGVQFAPAGVRFKCGPMCGWLGQR